MAVRPFVTAEQHADLSDALKAEYAKGNGESGRDPKLYYLDVTPAQGWALEDVAGLKHTLGEIKEERGKLRQKLQAFTDENGEPLEPSAARDAVAKLDEIKNWSPDERVKESIKAQVAQVEEKYAGEKGTLEAQLEQRTSQIHRLLVDNAAREALSGFDLVKGGADLLMPHIRERVSVVEAEDTKELVARVVDSKGTPRISMKTGDTGFMDVAELVGIMRDEDSFAPAFAGSGASGTGGTGVPGTNKTTQADGDVAAIKNPTERLKAIRRQQAGAA